MEKLKVLKAGLPFKVVQLDKEKAPKAKRFGGFFINYRRLE